ncbi:anaerobic c4-dicarboxylate antiporter, DcuC family [Denitrovibrio acetiphilus DSM 12809]|uniref:Anaerobic c4-dicarboxylate antiporter, DcuC family n=1 Tax=Denitrovibrio acetiphilus (strain DSM 12809 / NBRC 114555 / N2460) TaxID=522772 RepID=D4H1R5_DENA2|nr:C4-dicarboxylate transporter DcuC [Denitrovibrio acetiphilus]ADD68825.1 anaerobic c4-dicarboxylate antiporter, DcuC family [Denitrovibrio acetiphilus DSM 12809]
MNIILGIIIILAAVYFLVKQYDTRMVLIAAGLLMAGIAMDPLSVLDSFAKRMTTGGLIQAICSVMGFAFVMKATKCDQHFIQTVASVIAKARFLLIPAATLATFGINTALPSAAGTAAAVGSIFIPILISAGVHPALSATAVLAGTFGSMLSPGLSHNPFIAKLGGVDVMSVIGVHAHADIIAGVIGALSLTVVAFFMKEHKGYIPEADETEVLIEKPNLLYAIVPLVPLTILVLGSSGLVSALKMGVAQAMIIGCLLALAVTRTSPTKVTKSFFDGMGSAYGNIMGIIIAAAVFVGGMQAIGLVDAFIQTLTTTPSIAKLGGTFGPFLLGLISGSGDAAAFAFNEAVTPHANQFGMEVVNMGSMAALSGAIGRTMSPLAGAAIVCASIAKVNPIELAKRNALGMCIAVVVVYFIF